MSKIDTIIAAMPRMQRSEVEAQWNKLGAGEAPRLPDPLLRRLTAQMMQERRYGDVPAVIRRELVRLAEAAPDAAEKSRPPVTPIRLSEGTRLIREWNGRTIEVLVGDDVFEWEGRTYKSLSCIAREITGAHWSGPRFFGMRPRRG
ncbi:DUF2924 domain-containing protein [Sphingopyxis terrae]|uniref:DUF2924 domain-containing protein n=1 Tax=Sphingopyxis terrae TaxID=33052 RepID=UPI002A134267|nr:DUF2924 domain-containing protein [Sphingopyxis terrae]MDX8357765.1 DUF2924 domain-containing protein [Sphingopyxis terrae]